ncbi:hypothetical protein [Jatrophihabitans endophyticus]|uniref:hypothetical protein n=1 Tax=Jatrophihabitans endophyticus TaxID=1206085 RepID=UPI00190E9FB4|nr:hypothetical protein [Jatrophihabitans endophyticus]
MYGTVVWGGIPLGSLLGGVQANAVGVRWVFAVAGAALLVLSGVLGRLLHRRRDQLGIALTGSAPAPTPP